MSDPRDDNDAVDAYVLGLLDASDREAFEARMAGNPRLARAVAELVDRFSALDDTVVADPVPEDLWSRIEARLDAAPAPARPSPPLSVGAAWRIPAMAAGIVLALGVGYLGGLLTRPAPEAPLVIAVLATGDSEPGAIIEAFGDDRIRIIPLRELAAPEGRVLEVWTLPSEETGPVSLGTFSRAVDLVLEGPALPAPRGEQLYEITVEPEGGSPTGLPTGPILMLGYAREPVRL